MAPSRSNLLLPTLCWLATSTQGFVPLRHPSKAAASPLYGIQEWRKESMVIEEGDDDNEEDAEVVGTVPIHLMDASKVALQGERVYLQLSQDDEVRLFQQAVDCHHGVFGLGFCAEDDKSGEEVMYDTISLMEIQDYSLMGGDFGIFLSARVVGRAMILQTNPDGKQTKRASSNDQPLKAVCSEIQNRPELFTLEQATEMAKTVAKLIAEISHEEQSCLSPDDVEEEGETRWDRFQEACQGVLTSENLSSLSTTTEGETTTQYGWKELNAISWAAFSTSVCREKDETYRLAALDNDCMTNRLLLATYWLTDVLQDVKQVI